MKITTVLLLSMVLAISLAALNPTRVDAAPDPSKKRPNVLFVFLDDMGYRDLSCFGGTRVKTPEIDRLAAEGIRFNQFYVNSPICSPSRVAVTTGQYPVRWNVTSYLDNRQVNKRRGISDWLDPSAPSLARFLQQAGYRTAHVGKWHMGGQRDVADAPLITEYGFDTSITNFEGLGPRILAKFPNNPDGTPFKHYPTDASAEHGIGPITWVDRHRVTEAFVDRAIAEIQTAQKHGKPFYVNLWPDDVHSPCFAPPELRGDNSPAANYLGVLREADRQLGRIFDLVRSDPALRDNTIIVLASDNGHEGGLGSGGELRGSKGQLYEGGIRSPLIVWYPGGMPKSALGTSNDKTLLAGMDLAPSLMALAGVPASPSAKFDGLDLSDALVGRSAPERDRPVMWVRPPDRTGPKEDSWPDLAIRDGRWKLLTFRNGSRTMLFDVIADPAESRDIAAANPEVVNRLKQEVLAWDKAMTR